MKRRSETKKVWALACLISASSALAADPPAKPFESLKSGTTAGVTNFNVAPARKDGLKSFEEEITRSLQGFSPKGNLDGVLAPQYTPPPARIVIPKRKPKDDADWKLKWNSERDEKEPLNGLDGFKEEDGTTKREGSAKKGNSFEEYYKEMDRTKRGKDGTSARSGRLEDPDVDADTKLPSAIRESAKTLKAILGTENRDNLFKTDSGRSSVSEFFSSEKSTMSREQIEAHKDYVDRFRAILDSSAPSLAGGGPNNPNSLGAPSGSKAAVYGNGFSRLDSFGPSIKSDAFAATPGTVNSVVNPTLFPDMSAQVLNQWNPLYTPPKADFSRPASAFSSSPTAFDSPRRRF